MSEREKSIEGPSDGGALKQRKNNNANIYVNKSRGPKKPGKDRRMQIRSKQFDENLYRKMDG